MNEVFKSKLKFLPLILFLFPLLLLFVFLGIPKLASTINELESGKTNDVTGVFIPILFFISIFLLLIKYLSYFPKLTID